MYLRYEPNDVNSIGLPRARFRSTLVGISMQKSRLCRFSSEILALAALFLVLFTTHNEAKIPKDPLSLPAHIERGNRVARHYDLYSRQLAHYHSSLARALKEAAPELLGYLQPRQPIIHGYQILPRITPDAGPAKYVNRSVAYSWPWTDYLIDGERTEIARSEAELGKAMIAVKPEPMLQRLALEYHNLSQQHRNLDAHIQYNRLWQNAIAANRRAYDKETALHDQISEHQNINDRLTRMRAAFEAVGYTGPHSLPEVTANLRSREAQLKRRITEALGVVNPPDFLKIENSGDEWIIRVPMITDIEDREFVAVLKKVIEATWMSAERNTSYRVEIDISFVSSDMLYGKTDKPANGHHLDIARHLKRFVAGAAILTTGALTTHVQDNAIILGPHDLSPRVLAHEFGHILGFRDLYIRGYKDLAEDGFQVMEIVFDPQDIMAAAPRGRVLPSHFLRIIDNFKQKLINPVRPELLLIRQS